MIRSVTTFDAEWTDEDIADALDWQAHEDTLCKGCGLPTDETMAMGRDQDYDAEILVCHACRAAELTERMYRDGKGDPAGIRRRIIERRPPEDQLTT